MVGHHSSLLFLYIRTKSHREEPSQNLGGGTDNTHRGDNIFLRRCRRRTIFLHANRWWSWNRRTDPPTERPISEKAIEWVVNQEPFSMKPSIKELTKIGRNTTWHSINGIKANARIRAEQDADLVLKNPKLKILGQPHDDVLLTTDRRFNHYKANEYRIILKGGVLFRKNYGETSCIKYYQFLIPRQLVSEVPKYGSTYQGVGYVLWAMP